MKQYPPSHAVGEGWGGGISKETCYNLSITHSGELVWTHFSDISLLLPAALPY